MLATVALVSTIFWAVFSSPEPPSKIIDTVFSVSFEFSAVASLGDAASSFLVTVMVECIRLPAGTPLPIGALRTTLTSGILSTVPTLLMGPCLPPVTVMYALTAAMAGTAASSVKTTPQSTNKRPR